ncbi:MAG: glycosyltransferase family 9 protein [Deltaproteobacteria bacterium]|nr:glycosyltransferase family 9 protein [Deltaproteobacteria bacterium]
MTVSAQRILVVLHGAIGDVVRALPLINRLRTGYPAAGIVWAVEPTAAPLLEHHPAIDEIIIFERQRGARAFVEFVRRVHAVGADLTLDLQRHLKSGVVSWASGAPVRLGFHRRNCKEGNWLFNNRHLPAVEHFSSKLRQYQAFADVLGLPATPIRFGLSATEAERERVAGMLPGVTAPLAVIFVGSTWPSRFWFAEANAEVARGLAQRGLQPVLVGAPSEGEFAGEVERLSEGAVVNLAGQTQLRDLIALFERCVVALGPDSGPMHLAAAMRCRVVSLWGATSPRRSAPFGSEDLVIEGQAPCVPCYRRRCTIGRLCMQSITPAAVLAKVDEAVARAKVLATESGGS